MKRLLSLALASLLCLTLTTCWEIESAEPQDFWELEEPPVEEKPPVENVRPTATCRRPSSAASAAEPSAVSNGAAASSTST